MRLKTCKACHTKFQPIRAGQVVCSWQCAIKHTEALKAKRERKEHKERKAKVKTLTEWLNEAQVWVNRYIRKRDEKKPCISCGTINPNIQYAAGHYRSRGAASQHRFNHDNIWKQCNKRCNLELSGNHQNYRIGLIERIGLGRVEALENDNTPHKWTIEEAKEIIARHKILIKELTKENV